jgi:hypothetical protein
MSGVLTFFLVRWLRRKWLDYQSNKDRSYNLFDKAEFTSAELANLRRWNFAVPETMRQQVNAQLVEKGNDIEVTLEFHAEN